jgi:hypothetical protein
MEAFTMSETFRTTQSEPQWSGGNGYKTPYAESAGNGEESAAGSGEMGKALVVGVLGGLLSAAGYLVYQRLPEDQKDRLQQQAKQLLQQRISELRQNFNI